MKHITILAVAAMFICEIAIAQQPKAKPQVERVTTHEHLKVLEPFIGTWVREHNVDRDFPGVNLKKGDELVTRAVFTWVSNKNGIQLTRTEERKGGEVLFQRRVQLIAYDAEAKSIISFRIGPDGRHAFDKWQRDGEGWIVDSTFVWSSGDRSTRKVKLTVRGDKLLRTNPATNELQEELTRVKKN